MYYYQELLDNKDLKQDEPDILVLTAVKFETVPAINSGTCCKYLFPNYIPCVLRGGGVLWFGHHYATALSAIASSVSGQLLKQYNCNIVY